MGVCLRRGQRRQQGEKLRKKYIYVTTRLHHAIYSGFNDNNKFTYEFVKDKSTTSITKTPTPTKYDSYQRGSKRVTNITKEQIEGNINKQKEKSNSKLSYIDKLYKNESYPRKHINNSVDYQSKSRNNNLNRIKNKTEKTFNKYSTASCSGSLHESFSYKPSLNKTSLKIASNLESSMQRLTKKRKIYSSNHHKNNLLHTLFYLSITITILL